VGFGGVFCWGNVVLSGGGGDGSRPVLVGWCRWRVSVFGSRVSGCPSGSVGVTFDTIGRRRRFLGVAGSMLVLAIAGRWWEGVAGTEGTQGMSDRRRSGLLRHTFERFAGVSVAGGVVGGRLIVACLDRSEFLNRIGGPSWGVVGRG